MNRLELELLQNALKETPYNQPLLEIVLKQYVEENDSSSLLNLVNRYQGAMDCPENILYTLAISCFALNHSMETIHLLAGSQEPLSLLLLSKAFISEKELESACISYKKAIALFPELQDMELELQLNPQKNTDVKNNNIIQLNEKRVNIKIVDNTVSPFRFDQIGGLAAVKKQINRRIIAPFKNPGIFARFKRRSGGGILLYGPPGCGKTLLARATAGECNCAFFNVMLTDILSKWSGESEQNLHQIFVKARQQKPSVIFFDEIEAIAGRRQHIENDTKNSLVSLFLTELDGYNQDNSGVLILAATNIPWAIDTAFRRPGRFDKLLFIPPPDQSARYAILNNLLKDKPHALDLDQIVKATSTYSGADLKHLIETAEDEIIDQLLISESREDILSTQLIVQALQEVKPSTLEWLATARNFVEYANTGGQFDDLKTFLKNYAVT